MEKIKESCLTELIESLGASLNESIDQIDQRHRMMQEEKQRQLRGESQETGPKITYVQSSKDGNLKSKLVFQTGEFPTAKVPRSKDDQTICMVTGGTAKYKDPLTLTPFSNKDAFRVIRERFFQKEEEKMNMRIHTLNELYNQKKERLKRMQQPEPHMM